MLEVFQRRQGLVLRRQELRTVQFAARQSSPSGRQPDVVVVVTDWLYP